MMSKRSRKGSRRNYGGSNSEQYSVLIIVQTVYINSGVIQNAMKSGSRLLDNGCIGIEFIDNDNLCFELPPHITLLQIQRGLSVTC